MADKQNQDYSAGLDSVQASFSMAGRVPERYSPLPDLSWTEFLSWLLGRRSRYRIEGNSMAPTLNPGDEIFYTPVVETASLQIGAIVIAKHPLRSELRLIKRIAALEATGCWLLGDNQPQSTDSRSFGWVELDQLQGIATCRFYSAS